jgi:hypothetical protein
MWASNKGAAVKYILFYLRETKTPLLMVFFDGKTFKKQWLFTDAYRDLPGYNDICDQFFDRVNEWMSGWFQMPLLRQRLDPAGDDFWRHISTYLLPGPLGSTGIKPVSDMLEA